MKKIFLPLFALIVIILTGCFDNTQEATVNNDGTGTIAITEDMSVMMAMAKQTSAKEFEMLNEVIDTAIALPPLAEVMPGLTDTEKEMLKRGTAHLIMDKEKEKFITTFTFRFSKPDEIPAFASFSNKILSQLMSQMMGDTMSKAGMPLPTTSSFDDYFDLVYSKGSFERKLNKEKYAKAADDEYMQGMQQANGMGISSQSTLVINLPSPAKNTSGKNLKISDDKKKITIKSDVDDFFDDPSKMEFKIEY